MARKPPEKRTWNIKLYINHCILFKSFTSDKTPKDTYKIMIKHHPCLIDASTPSSCSYEDIPGNNYSNYTETYESIHLTFSNSWYNQATDTFEYFLISLT